MHCESCVSDGKRTKAHMVVVAAVVVVVLGDMEGKKADTTTELMQQEITKNK